MLLTLTACGDDFLDKTPEGEYVEDNFYDSDDAMYASTAPLYNRAWFDYNTRTTGRNMACSLSQP